MSEDSSVSTSSARIQPFAEVPGVYRPLQGEPPFAAIQNAAVGGILRSDVTTPSIISNPTQLSNSIRNAATRFIRAKDILHEMLAGNIEHEMGEILHDSACFVENLITHSGWDSGKQLCFGSIDPYSAVRTLGCQLFAESEHISWAQSANMISTRSKIILSTRTVLLGLLAAFTTGVNSNTDAIPALRPTDPISQFINQRMKSWSKYFVLIGF